MYSLFELNSFHVLCQFETIILFTNDSLIIGHLFPLFRFSNDLDIEIISLHKHFGYNSTLELNWDYFLIFKQLIVLFAALATINAQYIAPALTSQQSNIYRSFGNLGQVSTHSKTIDTPFSSVSKSDVRVSNPGASCFVCHSIFLRI